MKEIIMNGYKSIGFDEDFEGKQVIVRHDIDVDLDAAVEMSRIEREEGIKATYYVWLNSPFYSLFEKRYINSINEIISNGHDVGLHFDETAYEIKSEKDILNNIDKEVKVLEGYFGISITSVSFHRPSKYVLDNDLNLKKYINTYSNKFFKEYKYISDSNGIWREGCGCNIFKQGKYKKIQILTHPIWWKSEHMDGDLRLIKYVDFKLDKLEEDLSENIKRYTAGNFKIKQPEKNYD
jgi:hypothetical protein